jgi:hypothetical protein
VKTRLADTIGSEPAARLARAFFDDTWSMLGQLPWVRRVVACTGPFELSCGSSQDQIWPQGEGDLGARIERVLRRALRTAPVALAIGADTPGLPVRLLEGARQALREHDAVLGPADDGGFYLLGLRRCPQQLLRALPWSAPDTFDKTLSRLSAQGLQPAVLDSWFDVDRPADLHRLRRLIEAGEITAPCTRLAMAELP